MPPRKSTSSFKGRKFRVYVASAVLGAIASAAALVLFSLLMFLLRLPVERADFFSLLAFGIGCLVTGYFAGAAKRQGGLATGIKAAVLFAIPVALLGLVLGGFSATEIEAQEVGRTLAAIAEMLNKTVTAVLCGAVGGVLGVNKNGGFR
jgi:putative membrane protein (TIGR04086 family)